MPKDDIPEVKGAPGGQGGRQGARGGTRGRQMGPGYSRRQNKWENSNILATNHCLNKPKTALNQKGWYSGISDAFGAEICHRLVEKSYFWQLVSKLFLWKRQQKYVLLINVNNLAKARKMRKPPGTLGLSFFGLGKSFGSKKFGPKIFVLIFLLIRKIICWVFFIVFYFQRVGSHRPLGWQGGVPDEGGRRHIVVFSNKQQNLGKHRALSV